MRNLFFIGVVAFLSLSALSCRKMCTYGTLKLTNASQYTVQKVLVDGIEYGTLDPGKYVEIELAPGEHYFQQVSVSGYGGCNVARVIIVECETAAYECRY